MLSASLRFRKTNVIAGIVITAMIASAVLFAAQISFQDNTIISAGDVNNNFTELFTRMQSAENSILSAETFLGYLDDNIRANLLPNGGYVGFSEKQNSDSSIFEIITTGNYGVNIKKAGKLIFNFDADMITNTPSGNAYVGVEVYIDSDVVTRGLMKRSDGVWDGIHVGGVYNVKDNQVLKIKLVPSNCTLTNVDAQAWWHLGILWLGNK